MSDVMLLGVLRMPPELWHNDPISVAQRHSRYLEAAERIEKAEAEVEAMKRRLYGSEACEGKLLKDPTGKARFVYTPMCRILEAEVEVLRSLHSEWLNHGARPGGSNG